MGCCKLFTTKEDNTFEQELKHPLSKDLEEVILWVNKLKAKDDYVRGFEDARAEAISSISNAVDELEWLQKNVYDNEFLYYL